jgi:hypothetical protein
MDPTNRGAAPPRLGKLRASAFVRVMFAMPPIHMMNCLAACGSAAHTAMMGTAVKATKSTNAMGLLALLEISELMGFAIDPILRRIEKAVLHA